MQALAIPMQTQQISQNIQLIKITPQSKPADGASGQLSVIYPQGCYFIDQSYVELKWVAHCPQTAVTQYANIFALKNCCPITTTLITQLDGVQQANIQSLFSCQLNDLLDDRDHDTCEQSISNKLAPIVAGGTGSNCLFSNFPLQLLGSAIGSGVVGGQNITVYQKIPLRKFLQNHFLDNQMKFRIFNQMLLQLNVFFDANQSDFHLIYQNQTIATGITAGLLPIYSNSCDFSFFLCLDPNDNQHVDQIRSFYIEQKQSTQSPIFNFSVGSGQMLIKQTYCINCGTANGNGTLNSNCSITTIGMLQTAQDVNNYQLTLQRNGYNLIQSVTDNGDTLRQMANFNKSQSNNGFALCTFHQNFENSQIQTISTTNGRTGDTHIMGYQFVQQVA